LPFCVVPTTNWTTRSGSFVRIEKKSRWLVSSEGATHSNHPLHQGVGLLECPRRLDVALNTVRRSVSAHAVDPCNPAGEMARFVGG
jgi:hypothetical protein